MADSPTQGPSVPSEEAIKILNTNAASAAKRSAFASLAASQQREGRDALRRDRMIRTPTSTPAGLEFEATQPPPAPAPAPDARVPLTEIRTLLDQFRGTGGSVGAGGGGGGGGGGTSQGDRGGSPNTGGAGSATGGTGVQTFTNPNGSAAPPAQAVTSFARTGEYRFGSPVFRAVMGPASPDARYSPFVNLMVNPGVVIPNVSTSNIDRSDRAQVTAQIQQTNSGGGQ